MCTPMHQILPPTPIASHPGYSTGALYLGSLSAVMDVDLLRQNHITHLVQVLDVPWLPLSEKEGFNCYRIDILDQSTVDIRPHLEAACAHIDKTLKSGRSVLVHCQQGVSRSASIVIAYLIRNHGMTFDAAQAFVKHKRACIKPNSGFVKALQEWEASWRRPAISRRFTS